MPEHLYVYEGTVRGGRKVLVAICDDPIGRNHDEPPAAITASIPLPDGTVRLTEYPIFLEPGAGR